MRRRTISLAEDAYEALSRLRRPGESFSDLVRRLVPRRSLLELAGLLTKAEGDALAEAIEKNRRDRRRAKGARRAFHLGRWSAEDIDRIVYGDGEA